MEQLTGFTEAELVGTHFSKLGFYRARDIPKYLKLLKSFLQGKIFASNETLSMEFQYVTKTGESRWALGRGWILEDDAGKRIGIQGVVKDITESKKVEDNRLRYEERLEALHKHATELGSAKNAKEVSKYSLDGIEMIFGFRKMSFSLVSGKTIYTVETRSDAPLARTEIPLDGAGIITKVARTGKSVLLSDVRKEPNYFAARDSTISELTVPVKIGDEVVAVLNIESEELNAFSEHDQRLAETLALHVASAIERLRRLDIEREAQEKYRNLLDSSSDAVFVITDEGFEYINQQTLDLLGYDSPQELTDHDPLDIVAPIERERVSRMLRGRLDGEEPPVQYELRLLRKDGTEVEVENHVSIIEFEGKIASLVFSRDITERKQLEEE